MGKALDTVQAGAVLENLPEFGKVDPILACLHALTLGRHPLQRNFEERQKFVSCEKSGFLSFNVTATSNIQIRSIPNQATIKPFSNESLDYRKLTTGGDEQSSTAQNRGMQLKTSC